MDEIKEIDQAEKRKILFRGRTADGVWIRGYFNQALDVENKVIHDIITRDMTNIDVFDGKPFQASYIVEPETVGQFTGLYDKNRKEIFEGDIVSVYSYCDGYYVEERNLRGVVVFDDENFFDYEISFNHIRNCCLEYLANHRDNIEVIGNIYDNPELLEKKNNIS